MGNNVQSKETRDPRGQSRYNYVGITMSSIHAQMKDHLKDQRSKVQKNPMYGHDLDAHNGEPQEYRARILTREKSVFPLSLTEGLYIEGQVPGTYINERNESGRGSLVRLSCLRVS